MDINMDKIMGASFGESSEIIRASFKKTINVRQYETETIELSSTLNIEKPLCGIERLIMSATLQAQLEYEAYVQMLAKGYVTQTEFDNRKLVLESDVAALVSKGEQLLGKPVDYLFEIAANND